MAGDLKKILIVDDESNTREALLRFLRGRFDLTGAEDGESAVRLLQKNDYDLVLTDLRMPGVDGMGVMEAALSKARPPRCIVFTAYGSVEKAVEAVKRGAFDFVTKPVKLDKLEEVLNRALAEKEATPVKSKGKTAKTSSDFTIGKSPAMARVMELVETVAPSRSTVLITGESGTGKEVIAKAIHRLSGRTGLFVPVHCAALPENLLESELFGHERGAFTGAIDRRRGRFELADGGTLFLDEVGEIPPSIQVKLLRVLESRSFERLGGDGEIATDVRLLAATNRDLAEMVARGDFREDLFYRLNVVHIPLPPLRSRREDIAPLIARFIEEFAAENHREVPEIVPEAKDLLIAYDWPGNVRELRNCIERLIVLHKEGAICVGELPEAIRNGRQPARLTPEAPVKVESGALNLDQNEHQLILQTLESCSGNRTLAAEKLGISRRTLQRRLKDYGIQ